MSGGVSTNVSGTLIGTPFAGYERPYWERWLEGYRRAFAGESVVGLWHCNGTDPGFADTLRAAADALPFPVRVVHEPWPEPDPATGPGKNARVRRAWETIFAEAGEDQEVLCLESDVVCPVGGLARLREGLSRHPALGALSGAIPEHRGPAGNGTMAWRIHYTEVGDTYTLPPPRQCVSFYPERESGVEMVDAVPFGCLLLRAETFRAVEILLDRFPQLGHDQEWSVAAWRAGRPVALDWSVCCGHYRNVYVPEYEDLRLRMTTGVPTEVTLA